MVNEYTTALDLLFKLQSSTSTNWNAFTVTNVAIIGWLVSLNFSITYQLKLFTTVGYLVMVYFNYRSLGNSNELVQTLMIQLNSLDCVFKGDPGKFCETIQTQSGFTDAVIRADIIHAISVPLMLVIIWFGGRMNLKATK